MSSKQGKELFEMFGSNLQRLDHEQKMLLRIVLSTYIWGFNIIHTSEVNPPYTIQEAWTQTLKRDAADTPDHAFELALEILDEIEIDASENLLEMLVETTRKNHRRPDNYNSFLVKGELIVQ